MSKPVAVLISDIHYNLTNLELADKAMRMAISKANALEIPLIIAGDLHDTKANLRGECVNAMLKTFKLMNKDIFILRGNHDSINEKSKENSLDFLERFNCGEEEYSTSNTYVFNDKAHFTNEVSCRYNSLWFIPYYYNTNELRQELKKVEKNAVVIMHQGLSGSNVGDYIQDKSAITVNDVAGMRVISGHYHQRQTISLPNGGRWDYIGSPYTQSFGEAHDPRKGFQILYDDGNLEFIPTNLRKHVILTMKDGKYLDSSSPGFDARDLVWVKAQSRMTREEIRDILGIDNFKLTYELPEQKSKVQEVNLTQSEILDNIINDMSNTGEEQKKRLQNLWKSL